ARKFDAVVIPVAIFNQETDKYKVKFYKPLEAIKTNDSKEDIKQLTQLQANAIETIIKEDPKQWFWCHKRWKSTHANIYK
ncbi:MAG: lipid A biosynthesis acyltransferase, partial [Campylobacterota bacterium]|nr:lipid A biosynthesis acyltransferase [Campylobacterota bacterium]